MMVVVVLVSLLVGFVAGYWFHGHRVVQVIDGEVKRFR